MVAQANTMDLSDSPGIWGDSDIGIGRGGQPDISLWQACTTADWRLEGTDRYVEKIRDVLQLAVCVEARSGLGSGAT